MESSSKSDQPLQILHLEDNPLDAELIHGSLLSEWPDCGIIRVDNRADFVTALEQAEYDLILSDFSMPTFDGLTALNITRRVNKNVPFIFLSGSIGEDYAVAALQQGATDYVLKDRQVRLIPAIRRALEEAKERQHRRIAEAQYRESQDRFLKLAEQSSDVFWFVQPQPEEILYVSPAFEQVWGIKITQLYAKPELARMAIHPADRDRVRTAFMDCLEGRAPKFEQEYRIRRPDGSERWLMDSGIPIFDANKNLIRISGISKDVTDRKIAEQHIREQAELIDKANEAIYLRGLDDRIFYWNKAAEQIFGYTKDEVFGRKITELKFQGGNLERFYEAKQLLLQNGEWTGEFHLINRHGQELDLQTSWTLLRDEEGAPKSVLCIDMDVTQQRSLEKQFFRTQRQESIGTLAGGIAHDLNNVLTPILMSIELFQSKPLDAELKRLLEVLEASTKHGAGLIRQVLAFSRGSEGERSDIQPKIVIKEVIKLLGETLPRSIEIQADFAPDLQTVQSNSTELGQIVMNLCVNARDAMPNGGQLTINASNVILDESTVQPYPWAKPGAYVQISVTDTGTGIPPQILDRIFDPFFTTKKLSKGTGLGLSTVLGIVKSHRGILQVESHLGKGTTFIASLPASSAQAPSVRKPAASGALPRGNGETILVIDDEEPVRTIARTILTVQNYQVLTAEDGMAGIALYKQNADTVKAVITDMMMPTMQGQEVIQHLIQINPDVRIVAMSGMLGSDQQSPDESGRITFLQKPMTATQLLAALQRVLPAENL